MIAACSRGEDRPAATPTTEPPTEAAGPPSSVAPSALPAVWPLTGLPPSDPGPLSRPALVVKIDNAPRARPQAGLNQADVVVEEQVEGGVTRLAAIFHSADANPVGPVRSARSTDVGITAALNRPLFAYSGANARFLRQVRQAPLVDLGAPAVPGAYYRVRGRPRPYNLFTSTPRLYAHAPGGSSPPALFAFRGPSDPASGEPARRLNVVFRGVVVTAVEYRWDDEASGWRRAQNGTRHVDEDGRQVAPPNVVVQFVAYRDTGLVDQSGAKVPEAVLTGEGEAWVLTGAPGGAPDGGRVVRGRWARPQPGDVTRYTGPDGAEVKLAPGRTWVELAPAGNATLA